MPKANNNDLRSVLTELKRRGSKQVRANMSASWLAQMGWEVYPQGLRDLLVDFHSRYPALPPIYITENGMTKEEVKMVEETKKILDPNIKVSATCVRVPVFVGHSESVNIEFTNPITVDEVYDALEEADGVVVMDRRENGGYATPVEAVGEDATYVSRVRQDPTIANGINMWVVSDNLRKGAALNAVQIAETLVEQCGLLPKKQKAVA